MATLNVHIAPPTHVVHTATHSPAVSPGFEGVHHLQSSDALHGFLGGCRAQCVTSRSLRRCDLWRIKRACTQTRDGEARQQAKRAQGRNPPGHCNCACMRAVSKSPRLPSKVIHADPAATAASRHCLCLVWLRMRHTRRMYWRCVHPSTGTQT